MPEVWIAVSPATSALAVGAILAGATLGIFSGLTPGIHANNFALLMAAVAPSLPGPPRIVAAAMLAAGVTHTFLDVVPSLALGVPDAEMAASALPGHQLVLEGDGREALRLSAIGSGVAVVLAVPLAVPITMAMMKAYPFINAHLSVILLAIAAGLVLTETGWYAKVGGVAAILASGGLGVATIDLEPTGALLPAQGFLAPIFAGLFGAPVLIDALDGGSIPPQKPPVLSLSKRAIATSASLGGLAGSLVAYLPGVSSAIAAIGALLALPDDKNARRFIVATSGVNTANTVFALFAIVSLGVARTGVMVAMQSAELPIELPILLAAVLIAASLGTIATILLGDRYLGFIGRVDYWLICAIVLVGLVGVSMLFGGLLGFAIFLVAALIGRIPIHFQSRRVHCMGVLLVPLVVAV